MRCKASLDALSMLSNEDEDTSYLDELRSLQADALAFR